MSFFSYLKDDGRRTPFDPVTTGAHVAVCLFCSQPSAAVGVFVPRTDEMRAVVIRLRRHPIRPGSEPCLAYGVCRFHLAQADVAERAESALIAAAEGIALQ